MPYALLTPFRLCLVAGPILFLAACQGASLREQAADAYYQGDTGQSAALLDRAIEKDASIEPPPPTLAPADWKVDGKDGPLIALERAMVYLRAGDPSSAAALLTRTRDALRQRRLDSFTEFMGIEGLTTVQNILTGDGALSYAEPGYEELMARALLVLAELVGDRQEQVPFANQFNSCQDELLASSYGVQDYHFDEQHRCLPFGHYLEGIVREEGGNPDDALHPYQEAARLLPGVKIVESACARTKALSAPKPPEHGVVHVFHLLGRGPRIESSKWQIDKTDPVVEVAVRLVTQAIDILKKTVLDNKSYEVTDGLILNLTQYPVPTPFVAKTDRHVRSLKPVRCEYEADGSPVVAESDSEVVADFHQLAARNIEALRLMRLSRALLRRTLKELTVQAVDNGFLQAFSRITTTAVEDTDTRSWETLPAEIEAARLVLPQGPHEIDLGITGVAPAAVVVDPGHDTYIVVIDPGEATPNPTVLIDRLSRPQPQSQP